MAAHEMSIKLAEALNEKFGNIEKIAHMGYEVSVMAGRKNDRIVMSDNSGGRRVLAFVDKEQMGLMKAAGWKVPAKGVRYPLATDSDVEAVVELADPYGSFLYAS